MKKIILIVAILAFCGYGISIKFGEDAEINTKDIADFTKEKVKDYMKKEHLDDKDTLISKKEKLQENIDTLSKLLIHRKAKEK